MIIQIFISLSLSLSLHHPFPDCLPQFSIVGFLLIPLMLFDRLLFSYMLNALFSQAFTQIASAIWTIIVFTLWVEVFFWRFFLILDGTRILRSNAKCLPLRTKTFVSINVFIKEITAVFSAEIYWNTWAHESWNDECCKFLSTHINSVFWLAYHVHVHLRVQYTCIRYLTICIQI